jgi:hypothetical protein
MNLSTRVLGSSFVKAFTERTSSAVVVIGRDAFTRGDLAAIDCFNFIAAANLSRALGDLRVTSTRDVFERIPPSALALPHIGATALAVLGGCFEVKRLGGDAPLEAWMQRHRGDVKRALVTFVSMKQRIAADAERARGRRRRSLAHARRSAAHLHA